MTARRKRSPKITLLLTERALADIREIEQFSIKEWGRRAADRYLDDIEAALSRLQQNLEILRLEPAFSSALFFYRVKKHFLVCDYRRTTVIVLTIIHTSMDLPARLLELEPRLKAEVELLCNRLNENYSEGGVQS